jgi:hypothetical protein
VNVREEIEARLTAGGLSPNDAIAVYVALAQSSLFAASPGIWDIDAATMTEQTFYQIWRVACRAAVAIIDVKHGGTHWARPVFEAVR